MSGPSKTDNIPGYVHPDSSYSKNKCTGTYKTFTEGKKLKKNETFGNTQMGNQYSKITLQEDDVCPICSSPPVSICNCAYNDKKCVEGHIWYTNRSGKVNHGNPHT